MVLNRGDTHSLNSDADDLYEDFNNDLLEDDESDDEGVAIFQDALNEDRGSFLNCSRIVGAGNSPEEFVARFPVDKFDYGQALEYLKENYGGGEYRLRLYVKGRIKKGKGGVKLVKIAESLQKPKAAAEDGALSKVLDQVAKMNQQIVALVGDKNSSGAGSRKDYLEELMKMKELFSPSNSEVAHAPSQKAGLGEVIELIGVLKELGVDIGVRGGDVEEKGLGNLIEMAMPLFNQQINPNNAQVVPRETAVAPVVELTPAQKEAKRMSMVLKMGVSQLVNAAMKNSNPMIYAQYVVDNVPEAKIIEFFGDPSGMSRLIAVDPRVSYHLQWFGELGEHIKAVLGLPSKVSSLYESEESDNVNQTFQSGIDDSGANNLHDALNS